MIHLLQADANLKSAVVYGVRRHAPEVDFQRAEAVPLWGIKDPEVLAIAAQEGRVLVSHDENSRGIYTVSRDIQPALASSSFPNGWVLVRRSRASC